MRLLIDLGYQKVLFQPTADYAKIIAGFEGAQMVEESGPYDARVLQSTKSGGDIGIKLIADDDVRLPDVERGELLDKLLKVAAEKDKLSLELHQLKSKLAAIEKATVA